MKNIIKSLMLVVAFAMISQGSLIADTPIDTLKQSLPLTKNSEVRNWLNTNSTIENIDQDVFKKVINAYSGETTIAQKEAWDRNATTIVEKFAQDSDSIENLEKALDFLNKVQTDKSSIIKEIEVKTAAINNPTTTDITNDGDSNVDSYLSKLFGLAKKLLGDSSSIEKELKNTETEIAELTKEIENLENEKPGFIKEKTGYAYLRKGIAKNQLTQLEEDKKDLEQEIKELDEPAADETIEINPSIFKKLTSFAKKLLGDSSSIEKELKNTETKIAELTKEIEDLENPGFVKEKTGYAYLRKAFAKDQLTQLEEDKKYLEQEIADIKKSVSDVTKETLTADEIKSNFSELLSTVKENKGKTITAIIITALAIEEIKTGGLLTKATCSLLSQLTGWTTKEVTKEVEKIGQDPINGGYSLMDFIKRLTFYTDFFGK